MDTNRFLQLRSLFDQAVPLAPTEREEFLLRATRGDAALLAEARALFQAHDQAPAAADPGGCEFVGPYRVLRELGGGGMGTVYLAVRDDGAFRKQVAVKVIRKDQISADLVQRFQEERQLLANLDHPDVARILDGGQMSDGRPYFVMEYVEGEPLDRYCDHHRLGLADRIRLFRRICLAVHYLHENLVVHRDLKPSNILVTPAGTVKLLDFGIAKLQAPPAAAPDPRHTAPHQRLMTPAYASPEQISGAPVTKASDIYSLGIVLYMLLTGRVPFDDTSAKLNGEPPAPSTNIREDLQRTPETTSQLRRRMVGDLDQVVLKCFRPEPDGRYGSAAELAADLQRFLDGQSVTARRDPLPERVFKMMKRNRIAVAVCGLVLVLCAVGAWQSVEARMQAHRADEREGELARLMGTLDRQDAVALQPAARVQGVSALRQALVHEAGSPLTPQKEQWIDDGIRYLDRMRPYAVSDASLGSELASAYQQAADLYAPTRQDRALPLYQTAVVILIQAAGGDPSNGPLRGQFEVLATQIRLLGGTAPTFEATAAPPPVAHRAAAAPAPRRVSAEPAEVHQLDKSDVTVKERYTNVAAKCQSAEDVYALLRTQSAQFGQVPHPEITAAFNRMRIALQNARAEINQGKIAEARDSLDTAEVSAAKVNRAGGGN